MEFVDLSSAIRTETVGYSSKGNQLKWRLDDCWYKADHMGYEGLAEVVVADLLKKARVLEFVEYRPVEIGFKGRRMHGCVSRNFLGEEEELITLEALFRRYTGRSLAQQLGRIIDVRERILYLVENIKEMTGLQDFGEYLTAALEIDAFFLNEDRHMNNLAVIYKGEAKGPEYRLCPYFDHGLALYADVKEDFPLHLSAEACRKRIYAKTFSRDFDEQLDVAEELYGPQILFRFQEKDIEEEMKRLEDIYEKEVLLRVEEVLKQQRRKYAYLFE